MHYVIIGFVIFIIFVFQIVIFSSTIKKITVFQEIFPRNRDHFELETSDEEKERKTTIISRHANSVLDDVINSINAYLEKNKGAVSDFHLMKDIVDRNCDTIEEEINTQIPMPLYWGLVGTMSGILIGIGFLVFTGSLHSLLDPTSTVTDGTGIEELFGGIALAMITSIIGILLTTIGSHLAKKAKTNVENGKNTFLSWIQAELLPELSHDTTAVLEKVTRNLTSFNKTFSENTCELRATLQGVNDSYSSQFELIQEINKLKIKSIATANIEVYEKLKNCTDEIGMFSQYLQSANKYIAGITELNQKLDKYENRTQVIEDAGRFFERNERWLAENLDEANLATKDALQRFNETMESSLKKIQESLDSQFLALEKSMKDQENILSEKSQEIGNIVDELKNLTGVKMVMIGLEKAAHLQNQKMDNLTNAIQQLAEMKTIGKTTPKTSRGLKVAAVTGCVLVSATCLSVLIPVLVKLVSNLIK